VSGEYIIRKQVDWSLLHDGFAVPVSIQREFSTELMGVQRGNNVPVTFTDGTRNFPARLTSQDFDKNKYPGHSDIVQFRYVADSDFARYLREVFQHSYHLLRHYRQHGVPRKKIPAEAREWLILYTTTTAGVYYFETVTSNEFVSLGKQYNDSEMVCSSRC